MITKTVYIPEKGDRLLFEETLTEIAYLSQNNQYDQDFVHVRSILTGMELKEHILVEDLNWDSAFNFWRYKNPND